jgi:hypothetical protein
MATGDGRCIETAKLVCESSSTPMLGLSHRHELDGRCAAGDVQSAAPLPRAAARGSVARDLLLHYGHGLKIERATEMWTSRWRLPIGASSRRHGMFGERLVRSSPEDNTQLQHASTAGST